LNAEFQRIARTDKAFLSDQCKEIEENNRMGKIRDLLKKIRNTMGTLHAKIGKIKDRNVMHLTEAEDIKKKESEDSDIISQTWKSWNHIYCFSQISYTRHQKQLPKLFQNV